MSNISIIGLGAMGAALARAQLKAGHNVTVWNRSQVKAAPLQTLGATVAASVADAVEASTVIMICIDNYEISNSLLAADDVARHLPGRTLVQFTTGTPKEARDSEAWLAELDAHYLDGAIMAYPGSIGATDALIMVAGLQSTFNDAKELLSPLGGDLRYLGDNITAAAAIDMAKLSASVGLYMGVAHGAHICESEGVSLELLAACEKRTRPRELAEIIHQDAFELGSLHDGASVEVWGGVVNRLQSQANSAGINSELPDFLASVYARAIKLGHGAEDIAALIKALRVRA